MGDRVRKGHCGQRSWGRRRRREWGRSRRGTLHQLSRPGGIERRWQLEQCEQLEQLSKLERGGQLE